MNRSNKFSHGKCLMKLFLATFFFQVFLFSQPDEPRFINLSLEDGISINQTYAMIQDHTGFLWFGTMYGLIRYDGKNYKVYNYDPENPESISFNDVVSIFEDSKNNLWVGTWGGGLNMLNKARTKFKRFLYDPSNKNGIGDNIIWSIVEDKKGNIWLNTESGGVNKYNPETNKFSFYHLVDPESNGRKVHINHLYVDNDGTLWAGSRLGLSEFSDSANTFITHPVIIGNHPTAPTSVYKISQIQYEKLFLGTTRGLYYYDIPTGKFQVEKSLPEERIISVSVDHYGFMWLGTTSGLIKFNPSKSTFTVYKHSSDPNSLPGYYVKNVFEDKSDVIWVNCYNTGISKMINRKRKFNLLPVGNNDDNSLGSNWIKAIVEDKEGKVWVGTRNGLNKYNPVTKTVERITDPKLSSKNIHALTVDSNNSLIIFTGYDLYKYNSSHKTLNEFLVKEHPQLKDDSIEKLFNDKKGNLWIGTYSNGVFLLNDGKLNHYYLSDKNSQNKSPDYILSFYEDKKGVVWIGTYGGLFYFNEKDETFGSYRQELNDPSTLSNNYVYCMAEDPENNFWVGTAGGLNLFDSETGSFKSFFMKDGLPNDVICGIVNDGNGYLWISTQNGVSRFDPAKKSFTNFNKDDGLQSNLFSQGVFLNGSDNEIYFGGRKGLNYFNPQNVVLNKYESPVIISSVKLPNDEKEFFKTPGDRNVLQFDHNQNSIIIKVASLDYSNPDKINYRYKLQGYSNEWIDLKAEDIIKLQNLPAGDYVLTVQGTNGDGIWSNNDANLSFIIHPPFWKTTWFYLFLIIIATSAAITIHRFVLRSKVKRAVEIEKIKEQEGEKIRRKTAIDFHDELGHRLTRISMITEIIKLKIGNAFADITPLLEQISDNSKQLYDGTKDFIWSIDPGQDSLYELLIRLKDFGDELYGNTDVRFEVSGLDEQLLNRTLSMDWKRHITLIIKEGMNNSLKHSNGNKVLLDTHINGDDVEIKLEDNGAGFIQGENKKGMGLKNMKSRAEKLKAFLSIDTKPGLGTTILLRGKFPIKSLNYN